MDTVYKLYTEVIRRKLENELKGKEVLNQSI